MELPHPLFGRYIGIDYSGAEVPTASLKGLRIYLALPGVPATEVLPPVSPRKYWTRQEVAHWLVERLLENIPTIVGLDHAFSFPIRYFESHRLERDWDEFLDDFCKHWPTDKPYMYVDFVREGNPRSGDRKWKRLAESACTAKSVFHFDVTGSVAKSTHSGLPWLRFVRRQVGTRAHFWPFDGWKIPPNTSVVAEVYPSLWNKQFPREDRDPHQHDAFSVAETLRRLDESGSLGEYFVPPMAMKDRSIASIEGWILGLLPKAPEETAFKADCIFCTRARSQAAQARNEYAVAFPDGFPVSKGHTLIVPLRHEADFFNLSQVEQQAILALLATMKKRIQRRYEPAGYNVGINAGTAAGQTIDHVHLHLIPRYTGDVPDPRGGVRWVVPSRARYWEQ